MEIEKQNIRLRSLKAILLQAALPVPQSPTAPAGDATRALTLA